jgi:hypothetical protein
VFVSISIEMLAGPLLLLLTMMAVDLLQRGLVGQMQGERRRLMRRESAVRGDSQLIPHGPANTAHSHAIPLGVDRESRRPFDLQDEELALHTMLIGASGTGKTTTLSVLCDGMLKLGHSVVIVDCKNGGLRSTAAMLAERHDLPFRFVDPNDDESLGYDLATGDPWDVANKLIGIFTYAAASGAEIYKNVAQSVLPLLVRAMQAAGEQVTLQTLAEALIPGRMRAIGRRAGHPFQHDLDVLVESRGVIEEGIIGLRVRLDALRMGKYGRLFTAVDNGDPVLDWTEILSTPSVTYLGLSATQFGEDSELFGRVIAQDLKQQCARRIAQLGGADRLTTALLVLDEFAALREAEQVVDLLLQAREAQMPVVVSTQYIPEKVNIRQSVLQAGLIIAHRVEAKDAELIAAQMGTRPKWESTLQTDTDLGPTGLGSARMVDAYFVHPNDLRTLRRGYAAVRSVLRDEPSIVQVNALGCAFTPARRTIAFLSELGHAAGAVFARLFTGLGHWHEHP